MYERRGGEWGMGYCHCGANGLKIAAGTAHLAGEDDDDAAFNQRDWCPTRNKPNMITHKLN